MNQIPGVENTIAAGDILPSVDENKRRAFAGRKNEFAGRMRPAGRGLDKPDIDHSDMYICMYTMAGIQFFGLQIPVK
ncbi:hypothetical protein M8J77_025292 [Diaphorina citri]|nr:hypothetical protein M8J77_025292 [Diaphorina citri]